MYLIDTDVISERRKGRRANPGVLEFWSGLLKDDNFLPVQVIGELRRGVEMIRARGDVPQAEMLENWLNHVLEEYAERTIGFNVECANIWGRLMAPNDQDAVDKQIAAIALLYDLTVVTRNESHFAGTGAKILNPFKS